jgi:penicillin-binding protein 2
MKPTRNEEQQRYRTFTRRAMMLGGAKLLLLGGLAGRLYQLQVLESEKYSLLAEDNRINIRLLPPPRGRILDRFGQPLAVNRHNYRVLLVGEQIGDLDRSLDALTEIFPLTDSDRERIQREMRRKRAFVPITVRENLTWDQISRIALNAPDLPGISVDVGQSRLYPEGAALAHIVGYVGAVSERELTGEPLLSLPGFRIGKNGVEKQHDQVLRGSAGTSQVEVNALGREIQELKRDEGEPGHDIVLTLDAGLQSFVQQRLIGEQSAAGVVLNVDDGEVLAMASVPSFDPTLFNLGLSEQQWRGLVYDPLSPLTNKAIAGLYAPGSTFKMIVALAALEAGIAADNRVFCPGFMKLGNHRFHCWKRYGHGWMDMHAGIQQSCDVYFYDTARRVGIDRIAAMARRFGLGAPVGIDLPGEQGGTIPTQAWKLANIGEPWQGGETLVAAIGQGFVLATPLQLAVMTARLANGGREIVPRLTRALRGPDGKLTPAPEPPPAARSMGLDPAHLKLVQAAMDAVTNSQRGTAFRRRISEPGFAMAGKTGTSQVRRITKAERDAGVIKNEDLPWQRRDHGLFVGYAPVQAPRYACAVVVEHGGGGSTAAAPIVRDILLEAQLRARRRPDGPLLGAPLASVAKEA